MGLRDKLRGAMHPEREHEDDVATQRQNAKYNNNTNTTATAPGAFPEDKYDSKYDDKYDDKYDTTRAGRTDRTDRTTDAYGHRKADSGVDFGAAEHPYGMKDETANVGRSSTNSSQGEYWGNMSNKRSAADRKELPLRPNEQSPNMASSKFDDQRFDANRNVAGTANTASTSSPTGGTYNTVSGAGSRDYQQDRVRGAGYRDDDDYAYDSRVRDRDMGRDPRDSRDNRAAMGAGAAGVAGAGLAANQARGQNRDYVGRDEFDARDDGFHRGDQYQAGGGVPQTSMIDGQRLNNYNNNRAGPHDTDFGNKMDPRVDSDLDSRRMHGQDRYGGNNGAMMGGAAMGGAAMGASNMNSSSTSSSMGPDHFGPGHPGAKVVHRCTACGVDNDISQYFRKDITYRMG